MIFVFIHFLFLFYFFLGGGEVWVEGGDSQIQIADVPVVRFRG